MKQRGIVSMYMIAAIAVLTLLLAGAGLALKKQIEVNGEQRARIEEQAIAMKAAEQLRQEAEAATSQRDMAVAKITETNRRLQNEITKAITSDACALLPVPLALDQLLHERAPKAGEGLPAADHPARSHAATVVRKTWGDLARWAEDVATVVDTHNADKAAARSFCQ